MLLGSTKGFTTSVESDLEPPFGNSRATNIPMPLADQTEAEAPLIWELAARTLGAARVAYVETPWPGYLRSRLPCLYITLVW